MPFKNSKEGFERCVAWLEGVAETLRIGNFDETALAADDLQSLKTLTRHRQSLKEQIAAVKTHVVCLMDTYFPEYDGIFSNMFGKASLAVLAKRPLPADIARVRESTLEKIITEASHGRSGAGQAAKIKERARASIGLATSFWTISGGPSLLF